MNPCELPPCPPCPPPSPPPCQQVCHPPPPPPPCRVKPIMRGMLHAQIKRTIASALILAAMGGAAFYFGVRLPKQKAYREYYAKGEFEDWADEMARKGLFQSVPAASLQDNQHAKK
ncbi:cytochrome c oxidase subunit 6C-like [Bombyx mandarina]|uniref:Mitochondrial cytochrome c oxidase subunit VIc/VIIs domain-containing protein n=2 Tax=Bombyx TaxID=7090 RepID=A0A8R1WJS4_BOMMO|nr:cytochrome c oxidase subunit 6C [Bombyx mori]XP_028036778.1 cytochrome c oxidase subunit 6C-like [Bombyx mandarina]